MEPVTFSAAVASQLQTTTLISTIIGGIIGNRADGLFCESLNSIYKKITHQIDTSTNHDLQKAVRISYLKATLIACKHIKQEKYGLKDAILGSSKDLNQIIAYFNKEIKKTAKTTEWIVPTQLDNQTDFLLKPTGKTAKERLPELIDQVKKTIFRELQINQLRPEQDLKKAILEGWKEGRKQIDWHELVCAFFQEELKSNSKLATIIEVNYLSEINVSTTDIHISIEAFQKTLNELGKGYQSIVSKIDEVLKVAENIEERIAKIQWILSELPTSFEIRKIVEEALQKQRIEVLPNFNLNSHYQKMVNSIQSTDKELLKIKKQIRSLEKLKNESGIDDILNEKEQNLLQTSKRKNDFQIQLEGFIADILQLATNFNDIDNHSEKQLQQAKVYFEEGDFDKARIILNPQKLKKEQQEGLKNMKINAKKYLILAQLTVVDYEDENRFEKAKEYFNESITSFRDVATVFLYAKFLGDHKQISESIKYYKECLEVYQTLAETNPKVYLPNVAVVLNNLGNLQRHNNEFSKAKKMFLSALKIRRKLAKTGIHYHQFVLAATLNNMGQLYKSLNKINIAEEYYLESLSIYEQLDKGNPKHFLSYIAAVSNSLGILYDDINKPVKANFFYNRGLSIYRILQSKNSENYLDGIALILNNLGYMQFRNNEFVKAENSLFEALTIRRRLAKLNPQIYLEGLALTLNNLAILFSKMNHYSNAKDNYNEALSIYRKLRQFNPNVYLIETARINYNLGSLLYFNKELQEAKKAYQKSLKIRRKLALKAPKVFRPHLAETLNNLASLHRTMREYDKAKKLLLENLEVRRKLVKNHPSVYLNTLAETLDALGTLCLQSGQIEISQGENYYLEAAMIYEDLAKVNSKRYSSDLGGVQVNLALLYQHRKKNRNLSIKYVDAGIKNLLINYKIPNVRENLKIAFGVLKMWGFTPKSYVEYIVKKSSVKYQLNSNNFSEKLQWNDVIEILRLLRDKAS